MFAVPGWSVVPSALKPQTEKSRESQLSPVSPNSGFKSKKRKRAHGIEGNVTNANVDEMWKRHIEGQAPGSGKTEASKSRKDQKKRRKAENKMMVAENSGKHFRKENSVEVRKKTSEPGETLPATTPTSSEQNRKWDTDVTPRGEPNSATKSNKKKPK